MNANDSVWRLKAYYIHIMVDYFDIHGIVAEEFAKNTTGTRARSIENTQCPAQQQ